MVVLKLYEQQNHGLEVLTVYWALLSDKVRVFGTNQCNNCSLSQWPTWKNFWGITYYLIGKIKFIYFFHGPLTK